MTDMVFAIFRILLHHAIKYEYGGWRVWIDTLAILHSKVSYEDFKIHCSQLYDQFEKQRVENIGDQDEVAQHPVSSVSKVSYEMVHYFVCFIKKFMHPVCSRGIIISIMAFIPSTQENPTHPIKSNGVSITELKDDAKGCGAGDSQTVNGDSKMVNGHDPLLPSSSADATVDNRMSSLDKVRFYEKLGFDSNLVSFLSEIVEDASKVVEHRVGQVVDNSKTIDGFQQRQTKSTAADVEDVNLNIANFNIGGDGGKSHGHAAASKTSQKHLANGMTRKSEDRFSRTSSDSPDSQRRRGSKASSVRGGVAGAGGGGGGANKKIFTPGPAAPPFRIPEFKWSKLHQKLLSDVLFALETDIQVVV